MSISSPSNAFYSGFASITDRMSSESYNAAQNSVSERLNSDLYGQPVLASMAFQPPVKPDIQAKKEEPEEDKSYRVVEIKPGDALSRVLEKEGIGKDETNQAIKAMSKHFNPRHIKAGQNVHMRFEPQPSGGYRFSQMKMELNPIKTLVVHRAGEGFDADLSEKPVERVVHAKRAKIQNSVYGSAAKAGIPKSVVANAIRMYSWSVDFQRDLQKGDSLEIMYDNYQTPDGYVAKTGKILYANLTLNGKKIPLYRFEKKDGNVDYYKPDGRNIKKTLMKTPVDGARVSSGYGMRRHPILGYNKMHKGVDFAAPTGTPIYAAGDGVIERASRFGAYGHYVRIRHNSSLKTAYAHLHRYAKGMGPGKRVKQGDIIGYVGSTGRSTGPHLHYEVIKNGRQVNPNSINLPVGDKLAGKELRAFKSQMRKLEREYASLTEGLKFVQATQNNYKKRFN